MRLQPIGVTLAALVLLAGSAQAATEVRMEKLYKDDVVAKKDRDDAQTTLDAAQAAVNEAKGKVREASLNLEWTKVTAPISGMTLAFNPPAITGMSNTGGFECYLQSRGEGSAKDLAAMTDKLVAEARKNPALGRVATTFGANVPQLRVDLDREKAKALGVPVSDVFAAMQATFGDYYVNDFNKFGRTFKVQLQSEADFRDRPEDLRDVFVRSGKGDMIPLTALATIEKSTGPEVMERFNVFPAAKIMGQPAPGHTSGEALAAMETGRRFIGVELSGEYFELVLRRLQGAAHALTPVTQG